MKILIIEDEKTLLCSIKVYLQEEGYVCETAEDFASAIDKTSMHRYDCVLVDITLPGGNGLKIMEDIKELQPETGIIIISAKNAVDDKIMGLNLGADDYLSKPFNLSELNARVKSIIRRKRFGGNKEIIFNELRIMPDTMQVYLNEIILKLTKKEYNLLLYFITNKNKVITKESIAEHLWGDDAEMFDSFDFIYTHVKNLRKKMTDSGGVDYIKSIYGVGYKFQGS